MRLLKGLVVGEVDVDGEGTVVEEAEARNKGEEERE